MWLAGIEADGAPLTSEMHWSRHLLNAFPSPAAPRSSQHPQHAAAIPCSPPDGFALHFPNWAFAFPADFSNLSVLSGICKSSQFCILGGFCACVISSLPKPSKHSRSPQTTTRPALSIFSDLRSPENPQMRTQAFPQQTQAHEPRTSAGHG